jgi:MYXO-CTERM domain-containing protein
LLATVFVPSIALAGYTETFQSYPIGTGVVQSSSPVWQYYGSPPPDSGSDALVVADPTNSHNHVLNITNNGDGSPDVVTNFSNLLATGFKAELSYNVYMTASNLDNGPQLSIGPAALLSQHYANTLTMYLDDNGNGIFVTGSGPSLAGQILASVGGQLPGASQVVGTYSTDAWHNVQVDMASAGVGQPLTFSFKVDGVASALTETTTLTAQGITTIETAAFATANNSSSFVLIDNLRASPTPEPSSIALGLVGLVAMCGYGLRRRRRA